MYAYTYIYIYIYAPWGGMAAGVICYHMLSGATPFKTNSTEDIVKAVQFSAAAAFVFTSIVLRLAPQLLCRKHTPI